MNPVRIKAYAYATVAVICALACVTFATLGEAFGAVFTGVWAVLHLFDVFYCRRLEALGWEFYPTSSCGTCCEEVEEEPVSEKQPSISDK